jgi:hypothetical protein
MSPELDKKLVETYPKLFTNRYGDVMETAMCWGFECGDGWYNILNALCSNIQHHIDWRNRQREVIIKYNRIREAGQSGNVELFADLMAAEYGDKGVNADFIKERAEVHMTTPLQPVPELVPQVIVDQVKEKFGSLRFYYTGGDDYISGLTSMAESMSEVTCEECGKPGKSSGGGWISVRCDEHAQ